MTKLLLAGLTTVFASLLSGAGPVLWTDPVQPSSSSGNTPNTSAYEMVPAPEQGLDHVMVAVNDIEHVAREYEEVLGFRVRPGGKHKSGVENRTIWFQGGGYLELVTYFDRMEADWLAEFLARREGARYVALEVNSARSAAAVLAAWGFDVVQTPGDTLPPLRFRDRERELFRLVSFRDEVLPGDPLFFIDYDEWGMAAYRRRNPRIHPRLFMDHPNGATGIKAVWLAVSDIDQAAAAFGAVGLPPGEPVVSRPLGGAGVRVDMSDGDLLLLEPTGDGVVADFLDQWGEGIVGVTLEVRRLRRTRTFLERRLGRPLPGYDGPYGRSLLIPGTVTHGLWIEMADGRRPRRRRRGKG